MMPLPVEGFRDAVVSLPLGTTARRPVVIALHGNYDRPEWQCEVWRSLVGSRAFVLCPRGIPRGDVPKSEDRWTYGAIAKTEAECLAALDALKARYPARAETSRVVFAGFSLGAIQGRSIVLHHADRFGRVVLTEGGTAGWSVGLAKKWSAGGVERLLFACGQTACSFGARAAAKVAERGGITVRVASGGNVGHTYDGKVAAAISEQWAWLVEGEGMWDVAAD
jgi:predicted esterase